MQGVVKHDLCATSKADRETCYHKLILNVEKEKLTLFALTSSILRINLPTGQ